MTTMDESARRTEGGGRTSISLPSALRPARISISNGSNNTYPMQEKGNGKGNGKDDANDEVDAAQAFDTVAPDGTAIKLQSSPLSATKRLYATDSARAGNRASVGAGASPLYEHKTSPSRRIGGGGGLPSILPNSAFLTPRKPSHTPRYSQTNNAASSPTSAGRNSTSIMSNNETARVSPGNGPLFGEQQSQPSLFLAGPRVSDATESAPPTSSSSGMGTRQDGTSLNRSGITSTHGHANSSYAEGSNSSTVRSSFNNSRGRSDSRQDTLRSKTSREPLIASNGDIGSKRSSEGDASRNRRKSSKTGSITGLLGLKSPLVGSSSPHTRQESASSASNPMPTVSESNEKMLGSPGRSPAIARHSSHNQQMNDDINHQNQSHHTVIPIIYAKTHKPMRNYQVYREMQRQHKASSKPTHANGDKEKPINPALVYGSADYGGNNRFLLSGRLVTSGDSPFPFIASFLLTIVLVGAFFAFEAQWLWDASPSGIGTPGGKAIIFLFAYAALIMWTSMLRTSLRDPGIIVKGLDPEPDWESVAVPVGGEDDLTGTGMGQRPKLRHFKVRDEWVASKWCETCQTYRPPRTSHCRLCDVCTEQTDHHCSFLNNCIGRRNYSSFIASLISSVICAAFTIGVSAAHLAKSASSDDGNFWDDWKNIGSIILLVLSTAVAIPILGLLCYHCRLIWLSKTTIEILRPRYPSSNGRGKPANPYAYSRRIDNIIYNLCKPMDLYSAIQPHALAEKDGRKENPAFT